MKKLITIFVVLAIGLIFTCPTMASEINIVGTGDGVILLKNIGAAFSQLNPDIEVKVPESIGSGGGIKAVGNDKDLIGRVARGIKEKEKPYGLQYVPYAKIPVVFCANKGVEVQNLSAQQVCDIYAGKIENWKEVGGKDVKIRVVRREDGDSSLKVLLKSFPGFGNIAITSRSKTVFSTPENFSVLKQKAGTIGFGPYDVAQTADVTVFTIDGKAPNDPAYPSFGTMALIFKEKNKTGDIKKFVEFALSDAAHDTIASSGGTPY